MAKYVKLRKELLNTANMFKTYGVDITSLRMRYSVSVSLPRGALITGSSSVNVLGPRLDRIEVEIFVVTISTPSGCTSWLRSSSLWILT